MVVWLTLICSLYDSQDQTVLSQLPDPNIPPIQLEARPVTDTDLILENLVIAGKVHFSEGWTYNTLPVILTEPIIPKLSY